MFVLIRLDSFSKYISQIINLRIVNVNFRIITRLLYLNIIKQRHQKLGFYSCSTGCAQYSGGRVSHRGCVYMDTPTYHAAALIGAGGQTVGRVLRPVGHAHSIPAHLLVQLNPPQTQLVPLIPRALNRDISVHG